MVDEENGKKTENNDILDFIQGIDQQKGKRNRAKTFQKKKAFDNVESLDIDHGFQARKSTIDKSK